MTFRFGLLLLFGAMLTLPVAADVRGDLDEFWNANITGSGSFDGQAAGYYTFGNLRARTQVRNTQVATLTMPSIEAGCGGIDLHAGAFSFVTEDEIVQLARAIAANATGYAFELAFDTLCPVCASAMDDLRDMAQKVNAMNINSCEAARGLVGAAAAPLFAEKTRACATQRVSDGSSADYADALRDCSNPATATAANAAAAADGVDVVFGNVAWDIMNGRNYAAADWLKGDRELAEFLMTLTGTLIISDDGPDGTSRMRHIPGIALTETTFELLKSGGTLQALRCDTLDHCLNPTSQTITLSASDAIRGKVAAHIVSLVDRLRLNQRPQPRDVQFVNSVSFPLYRILNVLTARPGGILAAEQEALIDLAADDLVDRYLQSLFRELTTREGNLNRVADDKLYVDWRENIGRKHIAFNERSKTRSERLNQIQNFTRRVELVEASMAAFMSGEEGPLSVWGRSPR